jgi:hypothetical protein
MQPNVVINPYDTLLGGRPPYSFSGLTRILRFVNSAWAVIAGRVVAVRESSGVVFPENAFGRGRDIHQEEDIILVRIRNLLAQLIDLQQEQLEYLCDIETGHNWVHSLELDVTSCSLCGLEQITDSDNYPEISSESD